MGFFDAVVSGIGSFVEKAAPIAEIAAPIAGTIMASNANREAARIAQRGAEQSAEAIAAANALAQQRFEQMQGMAQPGVDYLRNVVTTPQGLFPEQQQALADLRREMPRRLNAVGLRGSGRAAVSAFRDVESRFVNDALARNRGRRDAAATGLAGPFFNAGSQAAGLDSQTGQAQANALTQAANVNANAETANAALRGQGLADIVSVINEQAKRGRDSQYENKTITRV